LLQYSNEVMTQKMTNKRKVVLIVDDEQDITTTLQITLEDNGFQVDSFNDPILALEILESDHTVCYF
jgi:DNA-binding NtrC family response regulator